MDITTVKGTLTDAEVDVIAIAAVAAPTFDEDEDGAGGPPSPTLAPAADDLADALDLDLLEELSTLRFGGGRGSVARIPTRGAVPAATLLVVGVGKAEDLDADAVRAAGAALAGATSSRRSLATTLPADAADAADDLDLRTASQALVEGLMLAAYRFTHHKSTHHKSERHKSSGDDHDLDTLVLYPSAGARVATIERGARTGRIHATATSGARDLVNEPPGRKRPPALADRVREELSGSAVEVEVLDEDELADGGYGGMLAVGKGSDAPPRLVRLTYAPDGAERHVALVGKGITFDSGGLSLKSGSGMMWMKADMAGAAAVYATVRAAAELEVHVRLTGILCLAENMPSATAQRPGDVYTARNGKTVEVLNTDAEGRLVLSDGLSLASELEPDAIVDVATLTGGVITALGRDVGGLMGTDDGLAERLLAAAEVSGERLWRLPLPEDYRRDLDSDVADLKNIGKSGTASAIIGGTFLREFVADGIPWAHLDIAGVGWSKEQRGYTRKGGTGVPVRTLLTWLADGAKLQPFR